METTKTLREIAEENGLEIIETTPETNGYPSRLMDAIVGFNTFEEARKIADEYNSSTDGYRLSIEVFEIKDGWDLWLRTGQIQYKEFEIDESWFGYQYRIFTNDLDEEEFIEQEITPLMDNISNFDELQSLIDANKEIYKEIQSIEDDEIVITSDGYFHSVMKQKSMTFYHDGTLEKIGLIKRRVL